MNDNERLNDIKLKSDNTNDPMLYVPHDDIDWLIERVQHLEESIVEATDFMLRANENEPLIKARVVLNAALEESK